MLDEALNRGIAWERAGRVLHVPHKQGGRRLLSSFLFRTLDGPKSDSIWIKKVSCNHVM